jgi:hypothetical protein
MRDLGTSNGERQALQHTPQALQAILPVPVAVGVHRHSAIEEAAQHMAVVRPTCSGTSPQLLRLLPVVLHPA